MRLKNGSLKVLTLNISERIITDNVEIFEALEQADNENLLIEKLVGMVRVP